VPFTMADIDRLSRRVPHLCKVALLPPPSILKMVHRAGGIFGILGEPIAPDAPHRDAYRSCANARRGHCQLDVKRGVAPASKSFIAPPPVVCVH